MSKPPLFPALYVACARGALIAIALIQIYYAFGAAGFSYGGSSFSFGRQHDKEMYAIDDERAFLVTGHEHPSVAIVKYGDAPLLFRLCGSCQSKKGIFPWPRYRKGNWVYTDMPWLKGPAAYDLKSGKLVTLEVKEPADYKLDPSTVPFYEEHGFTLDDDAKIDPAKLGADYKPISIANEMCIILQMVGFIVIAMVLLIGAILLPFGLARRRRAA